MTSFIQNMLWNSVSGFIEEGKRTVGGYAGDALIKAGDMVEGGGRSVGTGIEKKATGLGTSIGGQTKGPSAKALPSSARRPAAHRSNSLPASTKPGGSGVPLGAKKTPNTGAAKKQVSNSTKNAVSGITKTGSGVTGGVQRGVNGLSKPVGGVVGNVSGGVKNAVGPYGKTASNTANSSVKRNKPLPKPYGQSGPDLPKPYGNNNAFMNSTSEKKTAVRPGQSKPFTAPKEDNAKKPYPGTNTLPGQGNKTPVRKYKPAQRYEPPTKAGEATHLSF
ncbi:uncharacterized protein N0V89_011260 [Didymosphaeria variabile]|uniref:Uncharacterized protein n=1 Tax=Didymosphaeria variabile TaxID=1932322 RepID=A0A9W8XD65_9PLEO|nr:uncharacterized protein N0V89_011260 [Didymosphaeria variabile]KAJ4347320.1 hypothetical protein N0V89_011260 [Didymosphaeria variabile]